MYISIRLFKKINILTINFLVIADYTMMTISFILKLNYFSFIIQLISILRVRSNYKLKEKKIFFFLLISSNYLKQPGTTHKSK
jgi:hypothetical protein